MVNLRTRIKRVIKFSREKEEKQALICSAIRNLRPIEFYYHGGYRTVEPFALGIVLTDHQDNLSLLCWQTAGFSDMNETVGWKLYRVSDMEDLEVHGQHFTGDRPGYEPENLEMARLICFVQPPLHTEEKPEMPPKQEIKIEAPPVIVHEVPSPPPPPPPPQIRPIVRVLSHNQLMERFRYAHPQPLLQLEDLLWEEPLARPFPEPNVQESAVIQRDNTPLSIVWPKTPVRGLAGNFGLIGI